MCVVSICVGSILALFYQPANLQWTEIHDQGFICGSITVTFYVPTIGAVCGKLHFKFWRCDVLVHQRVQGGSEFITEIQPTATDNIFAHFGRLNKEKKERKHTGAHVVRSNLSSAWASCNLFGLQALIRSLIQLVALLGTSIGGRRPPRPRHGSSRLPEAKRLAKFMMSYEL
jgi:hypothetical protein